jgi:hypothetical protein
MGAFHGRAQGPDPIHVAVQRSRRNRGVLTAADSVVVLTWTILGLSALGFVGSSRWGGE